MKLWMKIVLGLVLGMVFGLLFGNFAPYLKPIGGLFINSIKMLVVPLIFSSLLVGVTGVSDPSKMGRIGMKTFLAYLGTTAVAITLGLLIGTVFKPGVGVPLGDPNQQKVSGKSASFSETIVNLVPKNPIKAMAETQVLQIIVFALLLGIALNQIGEKGEPMVKLMDSLAEGMYRLTNMVMEIAPYGVFALMAVVASQYGLAILLPLMKMVVGVYLGCIIHAFLTLGGFFTVFTGLNPVRFFKGIVDALALGYSTASSSGTLPVTMRCVRENLGVSKSMSSFVLPLGATINMDGTAMYQGVVALFIAQAYGVDLTFANYITIILTSTLASIGSAGIPGAGLIMLTLVLNAIGLPVEGIAIIAGVDRILDMARTTVNIVGDCAVCCVIAKSEGELDTAIFNGENRRIV